MTTDGIKVKGGKRGIFLCPEEIKKRETGYTVDSTDAKKD